MHQDEGLGLNAVFEFMEMPFNSLEAYWPEALMTKARAWILGNVYDGVVANFRAIINISPGELDLVKKGMLANSLDINFSIRDATVNYFPEQPFVYGVDGEGHADGTSMTLHMWDGTVENLYAPTGLALIKDLMQDLNKFLILSSLSKVIMVLQEWSTLVLL